VKHTIYWTPRKILTRLDLIEPLVYRRRQPIAPFRYAALADAETAPIVDPCFDDSSWPVIEPDSYWGAWRTNFMLRTRFEAPADWGSHGPVALHLPLGVAGDFFCHPEALAYLDGAAYASADRYHHEIHLPAQFLDDKPHALALHGWTGHDDWPANLDARTKLFMRECSVVEIDRATEAFIRLARTTLQATEQLDEGAPERARLLNVLDDVFTILDTRDPIGRDAFYDSVPRALDALKQGVAEAGSPIDVDIVGIGHAHIDVAWLWTLAQTRRKCGRSFSNVLRMMDDYPDYVFSQSQPQLYKYTEEDYPEIFDGIKRRVQDGRWEVMGGTWVEPDCNTTGAESLARQFLLGRQYFRDKFGEAETPVMWLPDTFGFAGSLPQLIRQSGLNWFVTSKISWNQYNRLPYQLFWWQGIDGTRVLTHFMTTPHEIGHLPHGTTYNGMMTPEEVLGTWRNFDQKETHSELITAYGHGDGGGGPTREMLDNAALMADMPGCPRVRPGTVREFFERVEAEAQDLPVWNGEFYLELHRGTLTSQARTKRNNRKSEFLLHDAEFLAAMAAQFADHAYPHEAFNAAWELVCLNQFHDILPGSSITEVYEDADKDYARIRSLAEDARDAALDALSELLPANAVALAANPTSFGGNRLAFLPGTPVNGLTDLRASEALATQQVDGGTLVALSDLPSYGLIGLGQGETTAPEATVSIEETGVGFVIENPLMRTELDRAGNLTSIRDKQADREVLAPGETGNQLLVFEDRPMTWDAWDIDIFYEDREETVDGVEAIEIVERGPLRASLAVHRRFRDSRITQHIRVYHDSKRIDFDTAIDWHESHFLLKAAFPVDILSPSATFDIQWGNVTRPTHRNTSMDWARFETAAQKWADLSEGSYGVALLNDCKYGYDVRDNVLRLTLLKSATMPDPVADQGEHRMLYSLLPHSGNWRNGVPEAAYALNDPVIMRPVSDAAGSQSAAGLVTADSPNAIIETVKCAEDGNGMIVRLYEGEGSRGPVRLNLGFEPAAAYRCNLLESNETELTVDGSLVALTLKPYEIVTLRLIAS